MVVVAVPKFWLPDDLRAGHAREGVWERMQFIVKPCVYVQNLADLYRGYFNLGNMCAYVTCADPFKKSADGMNAIHCVLESECEEEVVVSVVKELLHNRYSVYIQQEKKTCFARLLTCDAKKFDMYGTCYTCCTENDFEFLMVLLLFRTGYDINDAVGSIGWTAVIARNLPKTFEVLTSLGAGKYYVCAYLRRFTVLL